MEDDLVLCILPFLMTYNTWLNPKKMVGSSKCMVKLEDISGR